jgi:hypothetical protein
MKSSPRKIIFPFYLQDILIKNNSVNGQQRLKIPSGKTAGDLNTRNIFFIISARYPFILD